MDLCFNSSVVHRVSNSPEFKNIVNDFIKFMNHHHDVKLEKFISDTLCISLCKKLEKETNSSRLFGLIHFDPSKFDYACSYNIKELDSRKEQYLLNTMIPNITSHSIFRALIERIVSNCTYEDLCLDQHLYHIIVGIFKTNCEYESAAHVHSFSVPKYRNNYSAMGDKIIFEDLFLGDSVQMDYFMKVTVDFNTHNILVQVLRMYEKYNHPRVYSEVNFNFLGEKQPIKDLDVTITKKEKITVKAISSLSSVEDNDIANKTISSQVVLNELMRLHDDELLLSVDSDPKNL